MAGKAALQALGRQLDGGQGVLDFVGDPPGHLPPGRQPLGPFQLRQVLEHQHHAQVLARLIPECRGFDQEIEGLIRQDQVKGLFHRTPGDLPAATTSAMRLYSPGGSSIRQSWARISSRLRRSIWAAESLILVTRPAASMPITPAATFFSRISMSRFWLEIRPWLSLNCR